MHSILKLQALVGSKWGNPLSAVGLWTAPHREARQPVVCILFYASANDSFGMLDCNTWHTCMTYTSSDWHLLHRRTRHSRRRSRSSFNMVWVSKARVLDIWIRRGSTLYREKAQNLPPPLPPPSPHRSHRLNLMMAPSGPKLDFIGASEVRGGCCLFIANGGEKDLRPTRSASVSPLTKSKRNTSSRCLSTSCPSDFVEDPPFFSLDSIRGEMWWSYHLSLSCLCFITSSLRRCDIVCNLHWVVHFVRSLLFHRQLLLSHSFH
jgi:hypothetical protein